MKVSPVAANAVPTVNPSEGRSASADRIQKATAVAEGKQFSVNPVPQERGPAPEQNAQVDKIRKIKMKTNATPIQSQPVEPESVSEEPQVSQKGYTDDKIEPAQAATEETKPLSPQVAALAKEKRALQIERANIEKERAELASKSGDTKSSQELIERLKTSPLSVLQEHGVTYDKLTEEILASPGDDVARYNNLETKFKALEAKLEAQSKGLEERDTSAEQQALNQMKRDAERIVAKDDSYAMVRDNNALPTVVKLIHETWKKTGEILDVPEALELVENQLLEDSLKYAQHPKVQSRLNKAQQKQPQRMKTLTNRDGTTAPMSPKERAIAAFQGRLNK